MPETSARRPWIVVALVVALVALGVALFIGLGGDDDPAPSPGTADPGPSAETPTAPTAPTEVTPDEFCALFVTLADANSVATAQPDTASGQALLDAARPLLEMSTPLGMSPGARASLDELVAGSLAQLESLPDITVDTAPDPANAGEPDPAAFDAYLEATCPA